MGSQLSGPSIDRKVILGEPDSCNWDKLFTPLFGEHAAAFGVFGSDCRSKQKNFSERQLRSYGSTSSSETLGTVCRKGTKNGPNQDDLFFLCSTDGSHTALDAPWIAGVFDGHGPIGECFSALARNWMPLLILRDPEFPQDVPQSILNAFDKLGGVVQKTVERQRTVDMRLSGTTCVVVVHAQNALYVGWLGDSRALFIFGTVPGQSLGFDGLDGVEIEELTRDHKPEGIVERSLIEKGGGTVRENRVWFPVQEGGVAKSGLAMSRSLGDQIGHEAGGVCDQPDLKVLPLNSRHASGGLVLLASDGVFEVLTNRQAADIVIHAMAKLRKDPKGTGPSKLQHAAEALADEARYRFEQEGDYVDDITVMIISMPLLV